MVVEVLLAISLAAPAAAIATGAALARLRSRRLARVDVAASNAGAEAPSPDEGRPFREPGATTEADGGKRIGPKRIHRTESDDLIGRTFFH